MFCQFSDESRSFRHFFSSEFGDQSWVRFDISAPITIYDDPEEVAYDRLNIENCIKMAKFVPKSTSKNSAKKKSKTAWIDFEATIAQLEHMLSSVGAKVKHNVQLRDRFDGLRQVDAAVWIENGTSTILIIMECRNREKVSDITWVEQVVSKKKNLRVDRAIMATNNPLTVPAQRLAADEGIELRTLEEIDSSFTQYLVKPSYELGSMSWVHGHALLDPKDPEMFASILPAYELAIAKDQSKVFLRVPGREDVSFDTWITIGVNGLKPPDFNEKNYGGKGLLVAKPEMNASVVFDDIEIELNSLTFMFIAKFDEISPLESSQRLYRGAGPVERHIHQSDFNVDGMNVKMLSSKEANKLKLSLSIEPKNKLAWTEETTEVYEVDYNRLGQPGTASFLANILNKQSK